ncbi:hypothetical protein DFH09DRAFT_573389 [Mycena vulgaris]|nr:hypothetical protein DFH09DRAFT_573389 [Mycena vulgaris]
MRIFCREFTILASLLVFRVATNLSSPVAMNQLLQYIETPEHLGAVVRPWVWILMIFSALFLVMWSRLVHTSDTHYAPQDQSGSSFMSSSIRGFSFKLRPS